MLEGSKYLQTWFQNGPATEILFKNIPSHVISFTLGDSGAEYQRKGTVVMFTKDDLYHRIEKYNGTMDEFMREIEEKYHYIEAQLWDDCYCK